jgi:hypothetical protein
MLILDLLLEENAIVPTLSRTDLLRLNLTCDTEFSLTKRISNLAHAKFPTHLARKEMLERDIHFVFQYFRVPSICRFELVGFSERPGKLFSATARNISGHRKWIQKD